MYLDVKENAKGKVYVADVEHSHHPEVTEENQVPNEVMKKIKEYEDLGLKPREIREIR